MDQRRLDRTVNRRRFLKTAAGTTAGAALTAWSLKHAKPARAAVRSDRARAAEPNPKRGGVRSLLRGESGTSVLISCAVAATEGGALPHRPSPPRTASDR